MTVSADAGGRRFLALGDSYTIGEGVDADERWPAQLVRRLAAHGVRVDEPVVIAQTGWTTDELADAISHADLEPPYALVTLLIGVNNQYRGRDVGEYRDQFAALLDRAVALAGGRAGHVVVVSIPDWGVTGFARVQDRHRGIVGREIDAFNEAAAAIASARGVAYVDISGVSREAGDDQAMLVDDRLHPSAAQYALWTHAILPAASAALVVPDIGI